MSAQDTSNVAKDLRCKYGHSACNRERVRKENGELHSFCAYHRDKANSAQRRSAKKKRDDNRRKRVLRLAQQQAAQLDVPVETLLKNGLFQSDLMFEQSDLISIDESDHLKDSHEGNFALNMDDINWLLEALQASMKGCGESST